MISRLFQNFPSRTSHPRSKTEIYLPPKIFVEDAYTLLIKRLRRAHILLYLSRLITAYDKASQGRKDYNRRKRFTRRF